MWVCWCLSDELQLSLPCVQFDHVLMESLSLTFYEPNELNHLSL